MLEILDICMWMNEVMALPLTHSYTHKYKYKGVSKMLEITRNTDGLKTEHWSGLELYIQGLQAC